jgi:hypothetical protein
MSEIGAGPRWFGSAQEAADRAGRSLEEERRAAEWGTMLWRCGAIPPPAAHSTHAMTGVARESPECLTLSEWI